MSELKLTPAEERVKAYLEEQIKTDTALAAVYIPEKIKQCFTYIVDQARKVANSNSYYADDAEVWKWARDYYLEEVPKEAERIAKVEAELDKEAETEEKKKEPAVDVTPVQETVKEASAELEEEAKKDDVKRTALGFEIYGEESEEPEDAEQPEEPCHQEEVGEKEPVVYEDEGEDEIVQTIVEDDCITVTGRPKTEEEKAAEKPRYDEEGNGLLFDFM